MLFKLWHSNFSTLKKKQRDDAARRCIATMQRNNAAQRCSATVQRNGAAQRCIL